MKRQILVTGKKNFRITIPDDAKLTYGPFSPPQKGRSTDYEKLAGTLRVYQGTKENIIAVFTDVYGFRDVTLDYAEEVAREEGAVIWKSDADGYSREEKVSRERTWSNAPLIAAPVAKPRPKPQAKKSAKKGPAKK